ncbi:TPA: hypothetical protein HA338_10080 [Methanosarcina acetivorans]|uniref:Uncharacterized protein n=1 Tax=Methanosarcina acetivorans TaxID=2214 RepID=A0A832SCB6_9EURY|nr:hypothetical protein [Methanosarcina acetivorans]HIH94364.1 hypothetical protein [Methanosarcina acetivorans]
MKCICHPEIDYGDRYNNRNPEDAWIEVLILVSYFSQGRLRVIHASNAHHESITTVELDEQKEV